MHKNALFFSIMTVPIDHAIIYIHLDHRT